MLRRLRQALVPPTTNYETIPPRPDEDDDVLRNQESVENLCPPSEAETAHPPEQDRGPPSGTASAAPSDYFATQRQQTTTVQRATVTVSLRRDNLGEFTVIHVQGNPDYPLYLVSSFPVFRIPKDIAKAVGVAKDRKEDQWGYGNRPAANLAINRGRSTRD